MSDRADVLVIGGGVIGACVAAALAERGAAVTLLEREPEVCPPESAVYANCGLLVPSEVEPLAHPGALGQGLRWMLDGTSPFYVKPRASLALARWLWLFRGACAPQVAQAHAPLLRELERRQRQAARRARRRRRRRLAVPAQRLAVRLGDPGRVRRGGGGGGEAAVARRRRARS